MIKFFDKFSIIILILATSGISFAEDSEGGLFIEPAVTYESSETDVNYPSPLSNSTGQSDGFGLGARVGFHANEVFFVGLEGRYSMPQFKDSSVTYDAKAVSTNWGGVIGIQMPHLGMRLWGSYITGGELNPEKSGSFDIKFSDLSGYRVGTGFRIETMSLNIEYQELRYGQSYLERIGPFTSTSAFDSVNLRNQSLILSLSFPVEI